MLLSGFGGGGERGGLRAREGTGEWKAKFLGASDLVVKPPCLLRGLDGGGERPAGIKSRFSLSEVVVEADRWENALLLVYRSGEFSMLASSLATSAADNMCCGVYSELDRVGLLDTMDPASSHDDCGAIFGDAQGLNGAT